MSKIVRTTTRRDSRGRVTATYETRAPESNKAQIQKRGRASGASKASRTSGTASTGDGVALLLIAAGFAIVVLYQILSELLAAVSAAGSKSGIFDILTFYYKIALLPFVGYINLSIFIIGFAKDMTPYPNLNVILNVASYIAICIPVLAAGVFSYSRPKVWKSLLAIYAIPVALGIFLSTLVAVFYWLFSK